MFSVFLLKNSLQVTKKEAYLTQVVLAEIYNYFNFHFIKC